MIDGATDEECSEFIARMSDGHFWHVFLHFWELSLQAVDPMPTCFEGNAYLAQMLPFLFFFLLLTVVLLVNMLIAKMAKSGSCAVQTDALCTCPLVMQKPHLRSCSTRLPCRSLCFGCLVSSLRQLFSH
jgi:hypothetical protein